MYAHLHRSRLAPLTRVNSMFANSLSTSLTDEVRAILSGLVGGARYGVKIRLPHAALMTILFRRDLDTQDKIRTVIKLVWEHSRNLASFVTIYKSLLLTLKLMSRLLRRNPFDATQPSIWRAIGRRCLDIIGEQRSRIHLPGLCA